MKELSQEEDTLESLLVYIDRCHKGHPKEETVVASVFDVAKCILHELGSMSTWKLQKLCYYAQAWSLAWTETPLFDEDFEAWANGPVCQELYYALQGKLVMEESDITCGSIDNLTEDEIDTIDIIIRDYGNMAPFELRELSHSEEPWINARNGLPEGAGCNTVIGKRSMGKYYGGLLIGGKQV